MLEEIAAGPPPGWIHAAAWAQRMRAWAHRCERLIVLSPSEIPRADGLLGLDPDRAGRAAQRVRPARLRPPRSSIARRCGERRSSRRRAAGVRTSRRQRALPRRGPRADHRGRGGPHRQPLHRASSGFRCSSRPSRWLDRAPGRRRLVIVGGHPGEWEGSTLPTRCAGSACAASSLAGWCDHVEVPAFLSVADVFALASVREQFGLVLVRGDGMRRAARCAVDRFGLARSSPTARPAGSWNPTTSAASPAALHRGRLTTAPNGRIRGSAGATWRARALMAVRAHRQALRRASRAR